MNWQKRYRGLQAGDRVRMIKPCLECGSENTTICWEESFKDRICIVIECRDNGFINIRTEEENEQCDIPMECLERV